MIQLDSHIQVEWAGESRVFKLKLGEVRALETATGLGLQRLFKNGHAGDWKVDHVRETIRQGLIGGGMEMLDVEKLLKINFDDKPLLANVSYANAIIGAVLMGQENEPLGEPSADADVEKSKKKPITKKRMTAASPGQSSTAMPAKSVSRPAKSTLARTGNGQPLRKRTTRKPAAKT